MASFDLDTFLAAQGQGQGVVRSIGTSFGMPSCLLNYTEEALAAFCSLLPSPVLADLNKSADIGREKANQETAALFNIITFQTGIVSFSTETGQISFGSNSSDLAKSADEVGGLEELSTFVDVVGQVAGAAGQLYDNYNAIQSQWNDIKECIGSFTNLKKFSGGMAANERAKLAARDQAAYQALIDQKVSQYKSQLQALNAAKAGINKVQNAILNELTKRDQDPSLEPRIAAEWVDSLSGTSYRKADADDPTPDADEIIRLVYGPPRSTRGRYLLSTDGLYYDSQTEEGLEPVLLFVTDNQAKLEAAEKWKLNFNPNLGGKGDQISSKNFYEWVDTIFDENIIDDSQTLLEHYEKDHFLKVLQGQKEKRILDINKQIETLQNSNASQAVIDNFKQSILGEVAYNNSKINRRKKQIEIAVKAPLVFGKGESPLPGFVPINDFSYLQDCNIALAFDQQKKLVLDQESVSGVVLPLKPTFVVSQVEEASDTISHLYVPEVGLGALITDMRNGLNASSVELAISDVITEDGLFAVYNFLNSTTHLPSSTAFSVLNCVTTDDYNNAQLVAPNSTFVFGESDEATFGIGYGLGAAYMQGITRNSGVNPSALGSFVKLPDTAEFQDWLYKKSGASFETWVYAPYIGEFDDSWDAGLSTSSLYRLILACENTGQAQNALRATDIDKISYTDGSDYTKGLIMGFTRDKRWYPENMAYPSNVEPQPANSGGFILAPTVGYDASSATFMRKGSIDKNGCYSSSGWIGMFVPFSATTDSGKSLSSCGEEFCNLAVTLDYEKDKIHLYLDTELLAVSAVSEVFGSPPTHSVNIPTFKKTNSFEYNASSVGPLAPNSLKGGPKLNTYFTPWILGGGYTDGMALTGNFMGGEYNGVNSGLKGYLGSTKFYSKPLQQKEIKFNYSVQKKLYKNLDFDPIPAVKLVIAIGQSNIDGLTVNLADVNIPEYYKQTPQFGRKIWTPDSFSASSGSWRAVDMLNLNDTYGGLNVSRYSIGDSIANTRFFNFAERHYDPLFSFMRHLRDQRGGEDIYLIKNTKTSTATVSGFNAGADVLSWTDENHAVADVQGSGLFFTLKNDVSAAIDNIKQFLPDYTRIEPIVLMIQGEFESLRLEGQTNYPDPTSIPNSWGYYFKNYLYSNLQQHIKNCLGTPTIADVPWLLGRTHIEMKQDIPANPLPNKAYYVDLVRAQQEAMANDPDLNVYLVNLDGFTDFKDASNIHFGAEALTEIGERFFDKYLDIYGIEYERQSEPPIPIAPVPPLE